MSRAPYGDTVRGEDWTRAPDAAPAPRSVSVVVTHFDQGPQLERTLHALRHQSRPVHEVVVADDGSAVPPAPRPGVHVVTQEDRGFRASAVRNLGASRCTGDVLVFLDADTTPERDCVERLAALPSRLPELLAVGRRRHARLDEVPVARGVDEAGPEHELDEPAWLARGYAETGDLRHGGARGFRFVIGAVVACSRWWFEEIGGFDERFVTYGGEDWDLAHRTYLHGGLLAHVPGAVAWHDGPAAGETGRSAGPDDVRLAQSLALAELSGPPGAAYRGLLVGPPELVVTLGDDLSGTGVAISVDSLLAGLPRSRVVLGEVPGGWSLDPRVEQDTDAAATGPQARLASGHRLHLELLRPVAGSTSAWAALPALADAPDPPATTVLLDADGTRLALLHDLRQHRRAARWPATRRAELLVEGTATTGLQDATGRSLQWWLEGWSG